MKLIGTRYALAQRVNYRVIYSTLEDGEKYTLTRLKIYFKGLATAKNLRSVQSKVLKEIEFFKL